MMHPLISRIGAVLLLALAFLLGAGRAAAQTTKEAAMPDLDTLELRALNWRVEYGEALPAAARALPWRKQSISLAPGSLNISFWEGAPGLTWYGKAPPADELAALKSLAVRLLREHAQADWPGSMEAGAFGALKSEEKKRLCTWELRAAFGEAGGRHVVRELRLQGADAGDNAARRAFEAPLAEYAEKLVRRLHASAPKALDNLFYTSKGEGGAHYALSVDDDAQVSLSRRRSAQDEDSSEVAPALATRAADIVRKHGADGWHGFAAPDWKRDAPGAFELSMRYGSGQEVWARGLRGQAVPEGHAAFERELLAAFDEALDGPPGTPRAAPRQGLKSLRFSEGGMSYDSHITYHVRTRREAGRDVFHLMHKRGAHITGCPMSDEDVAALEALLTRLNLAAWDGFKGNARGVLDGTDFGLSLAYTDGREVSARGSNRFPKGYREAQGELTRFLDAILEKCK